MAIALKILAFIAITTYMLQVGLATRSGDLRAVLQRKGELVRTLLVMVVLGPLAARMTAAIFGLGVHSTVALVVLATAGVVPLASRSARSTRGDVPFALELTLMLAVVAAFLAGPTSRLVLGYRGPVDVRPLPLLGELLLLVVVPTAVGLALREKSARAPAIERVVGKVNLVVLVVLVVVALVLVPRYGTVRSLGLSGVLAAFVFAWFIAASAYVFVGPEVVMRRTVAGMANKPNVMLAIVIVTSARAETGFVLAIIGVFIVRFFTGLLIQALLARSAARDATREIPPQAI
jgi:predicted Na+-dependent transporter